MTASFVVSETDARAQYEKEAGRDQARQRKAAGASRQPIKPFVRSNGAVDYFEVLGPYNPAPPPKPDGYKRIFVCAQHNDSCMRADLRISRRSHGAVR